MKNILFVVVVVVWLNLCEAVDSFVLIGEYAVLDKCRRQRRTPSLRNAPISSTLMSRATAGAPSIHQQQHQQLEMSSRCRVCSERQRRRPAMRPRSAADCASFVAADDAEVDDVVG